MSYDLLITRAVDTSGSVREAISRRAWVHAALLTPALVMKHHFPDQADDEGVDYPAFGLLGQFNRPVLFWRNGEVIVKRADDDYLPELFTIAHQLDARLVCPDGTDAT